MLTAFLIITLILWISAAASNIKEERNFISNLTLAMLVGLIVWNVVLLVR